MATLVTGATGFIGQHVVRILVERGDTVHLLVRRKDDVSPQKKSNLKPFFGDIEDEATIYNAIRGCQKVIHLAACARMWMKDPSAFYRPNVLGTRNVLKSAFEMGIQKFVHSSSCSAVQIVGEGVADENCIRPLAHFLTDYARSKALAEEEVC